ncbi:MAG: hypothetical protein WC501_04350 [Candidatus Micrarchaeia archaeon]
MKAQITFEYLILFLVFISIISIVLFAIVAIKSSSEKSMELIQFNSIAEKINSRADSVCSLGSGNKIAVYSDFEINLTYHEFGIEYNYNNFSIAKKTLCKTEGDHSIKGNILIENRNGIVYIEK